MLLERRGCCGRLKQLGNDGGELDNADTNRRMAGSKVVAQNTRKPQAVAQLQT